MDCTEIIVLNANTEVFLKKNISKGGKSTKIRRIQFDRFRMFE